jgi:hypothetical protein
MCSSHSNKYLLDLLFRWVHFFHFFFDAQYLEFPAEELSQKCLTGYTKLIIVSECSPESLKEAVLECINAILMKQAHPSASWLGS